MKIKSRVRLYRQKRISMSKRTSLPPPTSSPAASRLTHVLKVGVHTSTKGSNDAKLRKIGDRVQEATPKAGMMYPKQGAIIDIVRSPNGQFHGAYDVKWDDNTIEKAVPGDTLVECSCLFGISPPRLQRQKAHI